MHVGELIKHERMLRGISCRKLAELAGISYSYLNSVENGKFEPTVEYLIKLGNILNVTFVNKDYIDFISSEKKKAIKVLLEDVRDKQLIDVDISYEIMAQVDVFMEVEKKLNKEVAKILKDIKLKRELKNS